MKKLNLLTALVGIVFVSELVAQEDSGTVKTRAIFQSTANSIIFTEKDDKSSEKPENKATATSNVNKATATSNVNKDVVTKKETKLTYVKQEIPAGVAVEVIKVDNNGIGHNVDPSKYVFKSGDKFIVKFQTNTPGYVEVYNINSKQKLTKLGIYEVPAFQYIQIPPNSEFKFVNQKGEEKLVLAFYPCNIKNSEKRVATRDIVLVSNNSENNQYEKLNDIVPSCKVSDNYIEYNINNNKKGLKFATRDIITTNMQNTDYSYEDGVAYKMQNISFDNVEPIITVLRFIHE